MNHAHRNFAFECVMRVCVLLCLLTNYYVCVLLLCLLFSNGFRVISLESLEEMFYIVLDRVNYQK